MAIATMGVTVLDCPDPKALAEFYGAVLGWEVGGEGDWYELAAPEGRRLAFQESAGFIPPQWPSLEHAQQLHLDLDVERDRLDEAERQVLALGARRAEGGQKHKDDFRVYLDPAGHPFCLCAC